MEAPQRSTDNYDPPHATASPRFLVLVAWGALAAGLGELAIRLGVRQWSTSFDKSFVLNPQSVWMGAIAAFPLMAIAVGAAWLVTRRSRRDAIRFGVPLGTAVFLAAYQSALTTSRVHPAALAALALGLTVQVVRWAVTRPALASRVLGTSAWLFAGVATIGGLGWNGWKALRERQARHQFPAPDAGAPNVLLLILDTVRASELSVYGYGRPTTPALARLASEGIRFDRALSTAPWTLPSHASMFTGRYPNELSVGWSRPLGPSAPTIAEAFDRAGYVTGGFVANTIYASWLHGLSRGFQHYSDYPVSLSETLGASNINRWLLVRWNRISGQYNSIGRKDAADVNREFLSWIDRRPTGRPFFAFLNYFDAHMPYLPPAPYRSLYLEREPPTRDVNVGPRVKPAPDVIEGLRNTYDGAITYLDAQLDSLFAQLAARGLSDSTIIVVTSDHGEAMGEHGFLSHGSSLYLPEIHVPLIIRLPRSENRGCTVDDWVTLRDLPATLIHAAGVQGGVQFQGHSLLNRCGASPESSPSPLLSESESRSHLPEWYPASGGEMRSLMLGNLHYIAIGKSEEHLYDTATDFAELHDLAGVPAYAAALKEARRTLTTGRQQ
jgi:arylsulfatase A-like enzyme